MTAPNVFFVPTINSDTSVGIGQYGLATGSVNTNLPGMGRSAEGLGFQYPMSFPSQQLNNTFHPQGGNIVSGTTYPNSVNVSATEVNFGIAQPLLPSFQQPATHQYLGPNNFNQPISAPDFRDVPLPSIEVAGGSNFNLAVSNMTGIIDNENVMTPAQGNRPMAGLLHTNFAPLTPANDVVTGRLMGPLEHSNNVTVADGAGLKEAFNYTAASFEVNNSVPPRLLGIGELAEDNRVAQNIPGNSVGTQPEWQFAQGSPMDFNGASFEQTTATRSAASIGQGTSLFQGQDSTVTNFLDVISFPEEESLPEQSFESEYGLNYWDNKFASQDIPASNSIQDQTAQDDTTAVNQALVSQANPDIVPVFASATTEEATVPEAAAQPAEEAQEEGQQDDPGDLHEQLDILRQWNEHHADET